MLAKLYVVLISEFLAHWGDERTSSGKVACVAALKNAELNGVEIRVSADDLIGRELPENFDLVLIGDLLYDEAIAARLETWLDEYVAFNKNHRTEIYIADPGRHGLSDALRQRLVHLRTYRLPENVRRENYGYDEAAVWKYLSYTAKL